MMTSLVRLWLGGMALRLTYLAVPPVLPLIARDFRLNATSIALLSGLPVLMLGGAALLGSLLIARLGARRSILVGMVVAGLASALRGVAPTTAALYAFTVVMGAGVAALQPARAAIVRQWMPTRVGFGTAVYTNGLLVGEVIPVALTGPVILPLAGGDWRWTLVAWSVPMFAIAALYTGRADARAVAPPSSAPARWWPDWRSGTLWRIGLIFGCTNTLYFATNAFLPAYLESRGEIGLLTAALSMLNLGQLPASFLLLAVADRIEGRAWPFVAAGACAALAVIGILLTSGYWIVASAALLGFSCAVGVIAGLALPPLMCAPEDIARTASGMFTISYASAVALSLVCGRIWDLTGRPMLALLPLVLCGIGQIFFATYRPLRAVAPSGAGRERTGDVSA